MTFHQDPWGRIVLIGLCIASAAGCIFGIVAGSTGLAFGGGFLCVGFAVMAYGHANSEDRW